MRKRDFIWRGIYFFEKYKDTKHSTVHTVHRAVTKSVKNIKKISTKWRIENAW